MEINNGHTRYLFSSVKLSTWVTMFHPSGFRQSLKVQHRLTKCIFSSCWKERPNDIFEILRSKISPWLKWTWPNLNLWHLCGQTCNKLEQSYNTCFGIGRRIWNDIQLRIDAGVKFCLHCSQYIVSCACVYNIWKQEDRSDYISTCCNLIQTVPCSNLY